MAMSTEPISARPVEEERTAPAASRRERIEFLNHAVIFAEANIRAYDTKSQIALAAFVFSMTPLWSILNATCGNVAARPIVAVLLLAFLCTIMLYGYVLWPIAPLKGLIKNKRVKNLFFVADPMAVSTTYADQLDDLSLEAELTAEVLKLSFIRASKGTRFRYALWATGTFYALVFVAFLLLRQCV